MNSDNYAYILWLPSWYPNKLSPFDGDFIQRHAQAASIFIPIRVLYFVRDKEQLVTNAIYVEEKQTGNLRETIIYYSSRISSLGIADKFFSVWKYRRLYKKFISDFFEKQGKPQLVHVHIAFKGGIIAKWIEKKYQIPYFLSEHWTIYLDEAKPNFSDFNFINKYLISKTLQKAAKFFSVSDHLGKAIRKRWPSIRYKIIPNVVDTNIFYPVEKSMNEAYQLVHISNLNYQKDPEKLFKAMGILKVKGIVFSLDIFGHADNYIKSLIDKEGIRESVKFHQEVPQPVLAKYVRRADALILYSRYETFGCVIIEANACGVPVIVTETPVMHELVRNNENGLLVKHGSAEALAEALEDFFKRRNQFSKELIAKSAQQYNFQKIGKMFFDEYSSFIHRD
jgi:glycosyltransferase involved in cell wall biosynthesis